MAEWSFEPLRVQVAATAGSVGKLRRLTRVWLTEVIADPDVVDDLTLAVSEAVENCVDHAFASEAPAGIVTLTAEVRTGVCSGWAGVVVTVGDDGHWLPVTDAGYRGRGLGLIRSCSDASVDTGAGGTRVTMRHRL